LPIVLTDEPLPTTNFDDLPAAAHAVIRAAESARDDANHCDDVAPV
jgi:hypothetical protein